jgi:hypothetical protein
MLGTEKVSSKVTYLAQEPCLGESYWLNHRERRTLSCSKGRRALTLGFPRINKYGIISGRLWDQYGRRKCGKAALASSIVGTVQRKILADGNF